MELLSEARQNIFSELERAIGKDIFGSWCSNLTFEQIDENTIRVPVPNNFYKEFMERKLRGPIENAYSKFAGKKPKVVFSISDNIYAAAPTQKPQRVTILKDLSKPLAKERSLILNDNYTFENFVVGSCNRMAHAASVAASEKPSAKYNPLFIYGGVGLGKTHLLQAICHHIKKSRPELKIVYSPCEGFVNDYIYAIQNNKIATFRKRYREADVVVIDDVHFLSNKEGSQEEFFHTFNALHDQRKQVVLSSDSSANEIPQIKDRISSRLLWGLSVKLEPPDYETRVAIIQKLLQTWDVNMPDSAISHIANRFTDNIRGIEGALKNVIAISELQGVATTAEFVKSTLKDCAGGRATRIDIPQIQEIVAKYYNIKIEDMRSARWNKKISMPKQLAIYLSKIFSNSSLHEIGNCFSGKTHTSIIYAVKRIEGLIDSDPKIKADIETLTKEIQIISQC